MLLFGPTGVGKTAHVLALCRAVLAASGFESRDPIEWERAIAARA